MIKRSYRQKTRERAKRMAKARWSKERTPTREERWEEKIHRAKLDRKGLPIATCYTVYNGEIRKLDARWSINGSVSQIDVLLDGKQNMTAGRRAITKRWPALSELLD